VMDRGELLNLAEEMLDLHRSSLFIDPFFTVKLELAEGDYFSQVVRDEKSPLSWVIKLNPASHSDELDVQYSVVEGLLRIICEKLSGDHHEKEGVIARIAKAFAELYKQGLYESEEDEED